MSSARLNIMASEKCWRLRRPVTKAVLVLLALCWLPMAACADDSAEDVSARAQLDRFTLDLTSLHAQFTQSVIGTDGAVQDSSSGEVWLKKPGRFRWVYGGDFPEWIIADGQKVWIYDEILEQVTVKDQSDEAANSPLALLTGEQELDAQFMVRDVGYSDELALLELRSHSAESEFERILLGMNDDSLVMMIMEDAFGLRTELRFEQMQRNIQIDDELFTFEPPPGTDVIGALEMETTR